MRNYSFALLPITNHRRQATDNTHDSIILDRDRSDDHRNT